VLPHLFGKLFSRDQTVAEAPKDVMQPFPLAGRLLLGLLHGVTT
jgi:hypothetical protein